MTRHERYCMQKGINTATLFIKVVIFALGVLICVAAVRGQSFQPDTITIVEKLADGSYVVSINGAEYRALPPSKVKEILQDRESLKLTKAELAELYKSFNQYKVTSAEAQKSAVDVVEKDKTLILGQRNFFESEYTKEYKLRTKYEKNLKRCTGKVIFFRLCVF